MKIDFFIGILMVFVGLLIISWVAQPDFATRNPNAANFLGFTGSTVKTPDSPKVTPSDEKNVEVRKTSTPREIKIIGASVGFENDYNQIVLYVTKGSSRFNLAGYILKTSTGTYRLPSMLVRAGDYVVLTSNFSNGGLSVRQVSPNHYEVFLGQRFLSSNYETAELYSSAGVLVSKYTYGLTTFF